MEYTEVIKKYAAVIHMCEDYNSRKKTSISPSDCVNVRDGVSWVVPPEGDLMELAKNHELRFAVSIVEGKLVFDGDVLYGRVDETPYTIVDGVAIAENGNTMTAGMFERNLKWIKKVTLGSQIKELPPVNICDAPFNGVGYDNMIYVNNTSFRFNSPGDKQAWMEFLYECLMKKVNGCQVPIK